MNTAAPDVTGIRAVVAGLGRTGRAAACFLAGRGARITVSDRRARDELGDAVAEIEALGGRVEAGGHAHDTFASADLVVVSPGVPLSVPALAAARAAGAVVWAEVELAARYLQGSIIGVTGSNGKSTVASLIAHLLGAAQQDAIACGNLGLPLISLVDDDHPDRHYIVELSSFQLEGIDRLRPCIAVMTNLTPDHQDRYASLAEYGAAKARIFRNQKTADVAVLNADDRVVAGMAERSGGPARRFFSVEHPVDEGAFLDGGVLQLRLEGQTREFLAAEALPLTGLHNVENALAAALAAVLAGAPAEALGDGLRTFRGLPHRMERVAEVDGVAWYNDSKATNLGATRRVIESMDRTLVVILGGKDKGADFAELRDLLPGRVRHLVLMGEARTKIDAALGDVTPTTQVGTMDEAVAVARREARPGDAVLLAPACASFDAYRNFEERGEHFRSLVQDLRGVANG